MAVANVTQAKFLEVVSTGDIVVVDFFAKWCGPCKQFAPIFDDVSDKHSDVHFLKVDTDIEKQLSAEYEISSIPTIVVLREGRVVFKKAGALTRASLEHLIRSVKELDMNQVRAEKAM